MAVTLTQSSQGHFLAQLCPLADGALLQGHFMAAIDPTTPLTWAEVLSRWQHDAEFQALCSAVLAEAPYPALFWEMPPLTADTRDQPYEWVMINSPTLARVSPNPASFAQHITAGQGTNQVTTFTNLGGDAQLIVPCQNGDETGYTHIAAFMRSAPPPQIAALWSTLGQTIDANLATRGRQPLWVSTSGLGVFWLHIRLDSRPKYYQHIPYKQTLSKFSDRHHK